MNSWSLCLMFALLAACASTPPTQVATTAPTDALAQRNLASWSVPGADRPFRTSRGMVCQNSSESDRADASAGGLTIEVEVAPQASPVMFAPFTWANVDDPSTYMDHVYAPPSTVPIRCRISVDPFDLEQMRGRPDALYIGTPVAEGERGWSFPPYCGDVRVWINGESVRVDAWTPPDRASRRCLYRLSPSSS